MPGPSFRGSTSSSCSRPGTGLRPATPDNTPVVGWTALPGVAVASGHFRNGMLLAPLTAASVVDLFGGRRAGALGRGPGGRGAGSDK